MTVQSDTQSDSSQPPPSGQPPVARGAIPGLGHIPLIVRSRFDFIDAARRAGPVSRVKFGPRTAYFVSDHRILTEMFLGDPDRLDPGIHFRKMKRLIGNGIVTTTGDVHRRQRRILLPSFSQRRLATYAPTMRRITSRFVNGLPQGEPYELRGALMSLGCDIGTSTLFGEACPDRILKLIREALPLFTRTTAIRALDVTGIYSLLPTRANRRVNKVLDELDEYLYEMIDERIRSRGTTTDLLSALVNSADPQTGRTFTRSEVRDQAITILLASTETTATAIAWACYELSRHPRISAACRDEVADFAKDSALDQIEIGRDDLPLLKSVLLESLRMYPPTYLLSRQVVEPTRLGRYDIPVGATILYSHYGIQRDERLFSHADEFDPSRWLPENQSEVTASAFMPFGHGARRCPGEGMAAVSAMHCLAIMLKVWDFALADGRAPETRANITLAPHNLRFVFTRREDAKSGSQPETVDVVGSAQTTTNFGRLDAANA
jgi:cytochrome P450